MASGEQQRPWTSSGGSCKGPPRPRRVRRVSRVVDHTSLAARRALYVIRRALSHHMPRATQ
eukprot:9241672-Lingulodinium_polyedra.AAC.1